MDEKISEIEKLVFKDINKNNSAIMLTNTPRILVMNLSISIHIKPNANMKISKTILDIRNEKTARK